MEDSTEDKRKFYKEAALKITKGKMILDAPMKNYTSMKVGGVSDVLFFPKDIEELKTLIKHSQRLKIPFFILGNGTNIIVRDNGIPGWVINLSQGLKKIEIIGEEIEAEAGLSLKKLIRASVKKELTGLEPLVGIPATVGGAIMMNAGAWGVEIKDLITSVHFMRTNGEIFEKYREELKFTYRRLNIPDKWIIIKGRFRLKRGKRESIIENLKFYLEMRERMQPWTFPSAGSIFKNPKEVSAGKLIEELGFKGFRLGDAMISNIHANFIVNIGKAKAKDIIDLIELVEKKVYRERGILLQREVRVVGE